MLEGNSIQYQIVSFTLFAILPRTCMGIGIYMAWEMAIMLWGIQKRFQKVIKMVQLNL